MTKFDFFIFRVNLFAVNQSYNLQSSWFTINSNDLRFLSAYRIFMLLRILAIKCQFFLLDQSSISLIACIGRCLRMFFLVFLLVL